MTTAAVWYRVSTGHQDADNQIPGVEQFAAHHGYEIAATYTIGDTAWKNGGGAGYGKTRRRALDDAHAGKFGVLVIWALDRIVRDDESGAEAALRIFRQFRQRGCMVVSVNESWLNGSPDVQDILIAFAGWMAEREPARRSERIKAGLARRRAEGKAVGRQARRTRASASGRATSSRGKRAARGARRQGRGERAMTRHVSSPCPSCGHRWLRTGPVPGGYARECPSCGWSQVVRREDERFHPCPAGRHWGPRGAAGILPFTVRRGRAWVLLSRRSPHVQHGGTWSCSGGAADEGETPWQAAVREASEEISGIDVNPAGIAGEHVWECPAQCGWSYTTFMMAVPPGAAGRLPRVRVAAGAHAWETDELAWVPASQVHARDLHPAFASAWPALRERIEAVARLSA